MIPNPSELTDLQQAAVLAAGSDGLIPPHFPRATVRSLVKRGLARRIDLLQLTCIPAQLTSDGVILQGHLQDMRDARR